MNYLLLNELRKHPKTLQIGRLAWQTMTFLGLMVVGAMNVMGYH